MPVALPRRAENQWPTAAMHGVKTSEEPAPMSTPNVSMKCQYSGRTRQHKSHAHSISSALTRTTAQ